MKKIARYLTPVVERRLEEREQDENKPPVRGQIEEIKIVLFTDYNKVGLHNLGNRLVNNARATVDSTYSTATDRTYICICPPNTHGEYRLNPYVFVDKERLT